MIQIDRKSITACSQLCNQIQNLPGLVTVGIGAEELVVYAIDPDAVKDQIPATFNGFNVVLKKSGKPIPA